MIFVGDDWAEAHHDVCLMDEGGTKLAARRLPEGLEGVARLHEMVAKHVSDAGEVVVGIETDRGLWVAALVAAGYRVYAINPSGGLPLPGPSQPGRSQVRPRGRQGVSGSQYAPTVTIIAQWLATAPGRKASRSQHERIRT